MARGAPGAPASSGFEITPSDTDDLPAVTRGIYVGTSGDLHVQLEDGTELTFIGIAAGGVHPLAIKRVYEDSDADDLIGLY